MANRYQNVEVEDGTQQSNDTPQNSKALFQPPTQLSEAQRGVLLTIFIVISGFTAIMGSLSALSLCYYMIVEFTVDTPNIDGDCIIHAIVQLYALTLCIVITFVEMEWTESIRSLTILQSWTVRGLSYIFVALLVFQEMGSLSAKTLTERNLRLVQGPPIGLFFFGLLYTCMGILCLKRLRDSKMARYIQLLSHLEVQNVIRRNTGPNQYR